MRRRRLGVTLLGLLTAATLHVGTAGADSHPNSGARVDRDDRSVTGRATDTVGGQGATGGGGGGGPRCWYEPLKFTTQEEQRTSIRPEEQRPGSWGWLACDDGTEDFRFFPESQPVDPATLARSVTITPAVPAVRTSPPGEQLVHVATWFWAEDWSAQEETATAGAVSVTVRAVPARLVIDPGDGSPAVVCDGHGTPYDPARAGTDQASECTHTYRRAGDFEATATVVYDVSYSSGGASAGLGTIEPSAAFGLRVDEAQAVVTG